MPRINAPTIDEHKRATRTAILDAAETAFCGRGYEATSLIDIADAAGVGRTTLYSYFASKMDLAAALAAERAPFVFDYLESGADDADEVEQVLRLVDSCLHLAVEHPDVAAIYVRVARAMPASIRNTMWASVHPVPRRIESLIEQGMSAGNIPGARPGVVSRIVAELVLGGVEHLLSTSDRTAASQIIDDRVCAIRCLLLGTGLEMAQGSTGR